MKIWFALSAAAFVLFVAGAWRLQIDGRNNMGAAVLVPILAVIAAALFFNAAVASFFFLRATQGLVPKLLVAAALSPAWLALGGYALGLASDGLGGASSRRREEMARLLLHGKESEVVRALPTLRWRTFASDDRAYWLVEAFKARACDPASSDEALLLIFDRLRDVTAMTAPALWKLAECAPERREHLLTLLMPRLWPRRERWSEWVSQMLALDGGGGTALSRVVRERRIDFAAEDRAEPCLAVLTQLRPDAIEVLRALGAERR